MITYIEGSLFTSTAQTLVNTVNTAGVMGKGLAKAFKTCYPEMFAEYARRCAEKQFAAGQLLLYRTPHKWVLNFPTKRHWRQPSRREDLQRIAKDLTCQATNPCLERSRETSFTGARDEVSRLRSRREGIPGGPTSLHTAVEAGLETFVRTYAEQGISSVAFPQLGCGNGGLDWEGEVRPLMERHLGELSLNVQVFITPERSDDARPDERLIAAWLHSDGHLAGFATFRDDIADLPGLSDIDDDGLWEIWRQLRHEGVVRPEDPGAPGDASVRDMMTALGDIHYLRSVRAARIYPGMPYDARSTQARFETAEAHGVQFVPPLFRELHDAPASLDVELDPGCSGSQTTRRLARAATNPGCQANPRVSSEVERPRSQVQSDEVSHACCEVRFGASWRPIGPHPNPSPDARERGFPLCKLSHFWRGVASFRHQATG